LQGEVAEGAYGHAVDELAEVLGDAVALELGGDGLRLRRGGTGRPSRLDILVLLLLSTEDDERWLDRACSSDARSVERGAPHGESDVAHLKILVVSATRA
jgi:hypothetical protein